MASDRRVEVRVPGRELTHWIRAARRAHVSLSEWIRRACNAGPGVLDVRRGQAREER